MEIGRLILDCGAWSYVLTFVLTFFEGETFVILAGFAAAQGSLSAPLVMVAAGLGSFAGDQCYFWIGRHFGLRLMARRPDWVPRIEAALNWLRRFDTGFILSFRFLYGIRNFSSFAIGVSGIFWRRFLILNFIAAAIWAVAFVELGLACGSTVVAVMGQFAHQIGLVLLAVVVLLLAGFHAFQQFRRTRQRHRPAEVAA
ncbi:MAG: DedA family protein, partial [Stellaceae bacterium]